MIIKGQKGAAIVEFAIILPLLVLLVVGIGEFGLAWYNKQVIVNAGREGARAGIARGDDFSDNYTIRLIVKNYANPRLVDFSGTSLTDVDITLTPSDENTRKTAAFGTDFKVEVTYNYGFLVPSLFNFGTTQTLRATERYP
ncbi:MAG: TadE/TadG family type IV pilus assembly protein [Candidatus Heimdallarchaeota archaeon]